MKKNITINGETIHVSASKSILESLENNGVLIESQCRDGFCGACRCKLIDGEVEYIKDTLAFLNEGEVLACSAVPVSNITIKV
jgi:ferredoxin